MDKPKDGKLTFIKVARVMTYLVYAYAMFATVFLVLGFFLLLLGASTSSSFVQFVYHISARFLEPFRGIFPGQQISDRSYFSAAGLFAIIIYGIAAMAIHAFINYLTAKMYQHQAELEEYQARKVAAQHQQVQRSAPQSQPRPQRTTAQRQRV